jgi:hypothetical protein
MTPPGRQLVSTDPFGPDFAVQEDNGSIVLSDDLLLELDRRIAYEDAHPGDEFTWEEVKAGVPRP